MVVKSSDELDGVSFLPITGKGGLGKTTLARLIFNDPETKKHFDKRIWVCVSTNFDTKTLFIQMLGSLGKSIGQQDSLATITQNLQSLLSDKRYLLILDDLWHEERRDWEGFKKTLLGFSSRKGNFIITTTRLETVASMVNPESVYRLDKLSDHDCWSLIKRKSFPTGEVSREFETIGYEIACKCKGLPLAANLIGASLQGKQIDDWTSVQQRELSDSEPGVQQILKVKDAKIEKERLIQLWIAEGFLSENDKSDMESVGSNVYDTLLKNSFLQEVVYDEYGNIEHSKMHDLVHDLAISVSKYDCFNDENSGAVASHVRYLAVKSLGEESRKIMKENAIHLRTLCFRSSLVDDQFRDLKRLHVLTLSGLGIQVLSSSVGGSIHLRLLDVSRAYFSTLPDSICNLYNLQTLNIYKCELLRRLPDKVYLLLNMRHLVFADDANIETPSHIGKLTCLRTLPAFSVGLGEGRRIAELGPLKNLKGVFVIRGLENVKDKEEAMRSYLSRKPNIQQLSLEWAEDDASNSEGELDDEGNSHKGVLEGLEPHRNIKSLQIISFRGDKFPAWAMNMKISNGRSLDKLVKIELRGCLKCEEIPTMGHLPFLKELMLEGMRNVKSIGPSFYNHHHDCENRGKSSTSSQPFRALEKFTMDSMPNLVEWVAPTTSKVIGFPQLKFLTIISTPKLKSIPSHDLGSLETLVLDGIEESRLIVNMACNNNLISLRKLCIGSCKISNDGLSKLIQSSQHHLERLVFENRNQLSNLEFPDDDDGHSRILPSFTGLEIYGCDRLESIGFRSGKYQPLSSLQDLIVHSCPSLASVELDAPNLSTTRISGCKISNDGFSKLIQSSQHHLERLVIWECNELSNLEFPDDDGHSRIILPFLKVLDIGGCRRLESIGFRSGKCRPIPSLQRLFVYNCPNLASVALETSPNLSYQSINNCPKWKLDVDE